MKNIYLNFLKQYWVRMTGVLVFVLLFSAYTQIFAIGVPYNAGETLNPSCNPGETNYQRHECK